MVPFSNWSTLRSKGSKISLSYLILILSKMFLDNSTSFLYSFLLFIFSPEPQLFNFWWNHTKFNFGPFGTLIPKLLGPKLPKIKPNLPFMVINLVFKFHRFLFTYTKVMVQKPKIMLIWAPFLPLISKLLGPQLPKSIPTFLLW